MANRHLARQTVLQTLYEWDFSEAKSDPEEILTRDASEFAPGTDDKAFMTTLLKGVISKSKDLDAIIEKAAPDWPINKIAVLDRNILRLGLYEFLFSDREEVPPKVAGLSIERWANQGKTIPAKKRNQFPLKHLRARLSLVKKMMNSIFAWSTMSSGTGRFQKATLISTKKRKAN